MIDWDKITKEDVNISHKIAMRAVKSLKLNLMDIEMDISATHISNPLDLKRLLKADDFNFHHDVIGIINNIDRKTGVLKNCFLPRSTRRSI